MEAIAGRLDKRALSLALLCVGALAAAPAADLVDAKKKKKQVNRRVGTYEGTTETGGMVSFRFTKNRQIVDFIVPNATLYCGITPAQGEQRAPDYAKGTVNITAPPIPIQGFAKFVFEDPYPGPGLPYARNFVDGKPGGGFGTDLKGNAGFGSANADPQAPGTETCATDRLDWVAKQVSGPGLKKGKKKD